MEVVFRVIPGDVYEKRSDADFPIDLRAIASLGSLIPGDDPVKAEKISDGAIALITNYMTSQILKGGVGEVLVWKEKPEQIQSQEPIDTNIRVFVLRD